ncbi:MAG TPA: alkaline phosphatase family protein [Verrucomicrobiae bacterium]|nr:alkaline phosphatase family protein [Verrucomicrobiae bacterium]
MSHRIARARMFLCSALSLFAAAYPSFAGEPPARILLISIDGLHAQDVARYVKANSNSALASLTAQGVNYTRAACAEPADSFPGMLAIATGGSPATTGVYFDVSYDHSLYPPGITSGPTGSPVTFDETVDIDPNAPDGGGGIDVFRLPLDPARGNAPVYPHNYLRVNTIFEVIKAAGYRTAWSDKHLSDEIVLGPSGAGIDDLYIPEIAALNQFGVTTTKSLALTEAYDDGKVQAILNEIDGYDHTRSNHVGVPAIFGMNFQAVSVAQRLKTNKNAQGKTESGDLAGPGGYLDGSGTPSALLVEALNHTDASLQRLLSELKAQNLDQTTYIVLTAKHGQSPIDPAHLNFVPSGFVSSLLQSEMNVLFTSGDNAVLLWLEDQSQAAAAQSLLLQNRTNLSLQDVLANETITSRYPDPTRDSRTPDVIAIGVPGTIFSGSGGKIAEHGGYSEQDLNVPIIISNPKLAPQTIKVPVKTQQLAPTVLQLLGLNPFSLEAVLKEHTTVLPGFDAAFASIDSPALARLNLGTHAIIHLAQGQADFQLLLARSQSFVVETSSNLSNWFPISTNSALVEATVNLRDTNAASKDAFYRVITPNPPSQ